LTKKLILKLCVDDRVAVGVEVVLCRRRRVHPRRDGDDVGPFVERLFWCFAIQRHGDAKVGGVAEKAAIAR
jgi:hypothetical protein